MKRVLVWGTFDVLHLGHLDFLTQAKALGDHLMVLVARDVNVKKVKGLLPLHGENERLQMVKNLRPVDEAHLDQVEPGLELAAKLKPDIVCLGYDQRAFTEGLSERLQKAGLSAEIVRLNPHHAEKYKSSKIKESLKSS